MSKRLVEDWLDGWLQYMEHTEPPIMYHLWTGISMISSALQRKCFLPWGMLTFYPNMYIVLVGPSGRARKGTAMSPGQKMLREIPTIKLASEAITREALIRELANSKDTTPHPDTGAISLHASLTVFSKELTVFLGYDNKQLMSDLTDWYDCDDHWTYRTKNMGTDEIMGVWVTLFGATTPDLIQTALPMDAIGGGLTSRIVFVYAQYKKQSVSMPFPTKNEIELREKLLMYLQRIHILNGTFKPSHEFVSYWDYWYNHQNEFHLELDNNRFSGYIERRPTHAMKLSMIVNASRTDSMIIDGGDLKRAVNILKNTELNMQYTFSGVGRSSIASVASAVLTEILISKETNINHLMARFYQDADKFTMSKIIETLESAGKIDVINHGKIIRARSTSQKQAC